MHAGHLRLGGAARAQPYVLNTDCVVCALDPGEIVLRVRSPLSYHVGCVARDLDHSPVYNIAGAECVQPYIHNAVCG